MPVIRTAPRLPPIVWLFFGLRGRIGRNVYWLAFVALKCIEGAIVAQLVGGEEASYYDIAESLGLVVLLAALYAQLAVSVKRLHDCDYPGLLALVQIIPLVEIFFLIWVGIMPGTPGPNRFGAGPDRQPL